MWNNRLKKNAANRPAEPAAPTAGTPGGQGNRVPDGILRRVYWVVAIFLVAGVLVVLQTVRIQTVQQNDWLAQQRRQNVYPRTLLADRGSILADDGSILAVTLPFYRFAVDPHAWQETNFESLTDSIDALCTALATHFGEGEHTAEHFRSRILEARTRRVANSRDSLDHHLYLFHPGRRFSLQDLRLLQTFPILNQGRYKGGFIVEKVNNKRFYPLGDLATITLGRLADDTTGTRGIEFSFNNMLRGRDGSVVVQRVAGGTEVPLDYFSEIEPANGLDLLTTLNVNLQDVAYNAIREAVVEHEAKRGVVILMETHSGHIKALANYPEDYNLAVAQAMEPGSTFKIASMMAALEDGFVTGNTLVNTGNTGEHGFYDDVMRDNDPYGEITLQEAIEKSSNIAIAKVIQQYYGRQPQKFIERLTEIGALSPSYGQLRGEPEPYIIRPGTEAWDGITLPWLSTGYNVKLTPLQVLTYFNGIANNGRIVSPVLVSEARNGANRVQRYTGRVINARMCSSTTLEQIRRMMEGVVERGTAKGIHNPNLRLAGKSGTAKKLENGRYTAKYSASFVGYFPADDPQYTCIVVIDEPGGSLYYGGKICAPVFRQVADYIYSTRSPGSFRSVPTYAGASRQLPASRLAQLEDVSTFTRAFGLAYAAPTNLRPNTPTAFVRTQRSDDGLVAEAQYLQRGLVPDVRGMSSRNALQLLENQGLRVRLQGHGHVRSQSLLPGRRLRRGEQITLYLNE
jgi:cell division protein FtsI (penicillin-binding protein 3)